MKILIIEDDDVIVENVALTLKVGWQEAELISACLGEEGIEMVGSEAPDLVILDLGLPDMDGFDVLKQIRLYSEVPVIILTVREDETEVVKAFDLGADEYLFKPFRQMELIARLQSIIRRKHLSSIDIYQKCGPFNINYASHMVKYGDRIIRLTSNELLLLNHLAQNQGKAVSCASIAEILWGTDYPGSNKAIRVYIRQLRQKIEKDPNNPKLIITKPTIGYALA